MLYFPNKKIHDEIIPRGGKTKRSTNKIGTRLMEYRFENDGDVLKVYLSGRLVASCAEEFKETMLENLKDHKKVLFNLQHMEHVDSSGLGALVSILQWENTNAGTVKLCCLQPRPKIVFDITKVHRIFEIFDTEAAAMEAFSKMA